MPNYYYYYSKFFNNLLLTNLPFHSHILFSPFQFIMIQLFCASERFRSLHALLCFCLPIYHFSLSLAVIYLYFYLYLSSYPALFLSLSLLLLTPKIPFISFLHIEIYAYFKMLCFHVCICLHAPGIMTQTCPGVSRSLQQRHGLVMACCRVWGTENISVCMGPFERGRHHLHYLHYSFS